MASKLLKLSIVFVLVFASCSKDETIQQDKVAIPVTQKEPLTAKQVNAQIDHTPAARCGNQCGDQDRKSTRLNSSH